MNKFTAFVILVVIGVVALFLGAMVAPIFGETEKECIQYNGEHLKKIYAASVGGGCDWVAEKYFVDGWTITQFDSVPTNGFGACGCDVWILTHK